MRLLLQRVTHGSVSVDGKVVGKVGKGYVILVGVGHQDGEAQTAWLAQKVAGLRVFEDSEGKVNLSIQNVGGGALGISQFTLYARGDKGRRPTFIQTSLPQQARQL